MELITSKLPFTGGVEASRNLTEGVKIPLYYFHTVVVSERLNTEGTQLSVSSVDNLSNYHAV